MLDPLEQFLVRSVEARLPEELAFLQEIVDLDSGTFNLAGVREVGRRFERELTALGFTARWADLPPEVGRAGHLVAERVSAEGEARRIRLLLLGHIDTIFEGAGHRFQRSGDGSPSARAGNRARGAGITDMKGGCAALVFALKALHEAGALEGATVRVFLTGDEENPGLPTGVSRGPLIEAARQSDVALSFEPDSGRVAIGRRGLSTWSLAAAGEQAHSAAVLRENGGAGAIYEAARVLEGFRSAFSGHANITVNPGLFLGGTGADYDPATSSGTASGKFNVIARAAILRGDLRFLTDAERDEAKAKMLEIAAASLPKTSSRLEFQDLAPGWPASGGNRAILELIDRTSRDLGLGAVEADDPASRGFGDINFIGAAVAGADGLGVKGVGEHGPDETLDVASVAPCTARAAVVISRLLADRRQEPSGVRR